jgi:hypothetical protein
MGSPKKCERSRLLGTWYLTVFPKKIETKLFIFHTKKKYRSASQVTPSICPVVEFYTTFVLGILTKAVRGRGQFLWASLKITKIVLLYLKYDTYFTCKTQSPEFL